MPGYRVRIKDLRNGESFECWFRDLRKACEQVVAYTNEDVVRIECGRESLRNINPEWYFFEVDANAHRITAIHSNDPVSYLLCGCRVYQRDWGWELVDTVSERSTRLVSVNGSRRFFVAA